MTRWLGRLAFLVAMAAPIGVRGAPLQAPHDQTFGDGKCDACHGLYIRNVNGKSDYSPGCVACHNAPATVAITTFQFPWGEGDQAKKGAGGAQHSWSGQATNSAAGANTPIAAVISGKLVDGKLQCATCHDVHNSSPSYAPKAKHASAKLGVEKTHTAGTGTGTMTLVAVGSDTKGFRVQISSANADGSAGQFVVSHDFGLQQSTWFTWVNGAWTTGTIAGPGKPFTAGADVTLDDTSVTVRFTSGVKVGDYWDFYVSYPFLRATNVADAFCQMCHAERVMTHVRAGGRDPFYAPDGVKMFSHPVGEALNANHQGYDLSAVTMLDANGAPQASRTEGHDSNDLVLDAGDGAEAPVVRCTTCHAVHNADSNSLTDDAR